MGKKDTLPPNPALNLLTQAPPPPDVMVGGRGWGGCSWLLNPRTGCQSLSPAGTDGMEEGMGGGQQRGWVKPGITGAFPGPNSNSGRRL